MALASLEACGTVPIQEMNFYTDATPNGAIETHFYSTEVSYLGQAAWDALREGMTCESAQDFANWKSELEKLCSRVKCTEETQNLITALDRIVKIQLH